jgi:hypothetical protein
LPELAGEDAFCIIVIAGEKYDPETKMVNEDAIIESQKLL